MRITQIFRNAHSEASYRYSVIASNTADAAGRIQNKVSGYIPTEHDVIDGGKHLVSANGLLSGLRLHAASPKVLEQLKENVHDNVNSMMHGTLLSFGIDGVRKSQAFVSSVTYPHASKSELDSLKLKQRDYNKAVLRYNFWLKHRKDDLRSFSKTVPGTSAFDTLSKRLKSGVEPSRMLPENDPKRVFVEQYPNIEKLQAELFPCALELRLAKDRARHSSMDNNQGSQRTFLARQLFRAKEFTTGTKFSVKKTLNNAHVALENLSSKSPNPRYYELMDDPH